jgi:hypothetical protein
MAEYIAGVKGVNLSQIRCPAPMVQITVEGWSDTAKGHHMTPRTWEYLTIAEAVSIAKAILNRYEPTALADHTNALSVIEDMVEVVE